MTTDRQTGKPKTIELRQQKLCAYRSVLSIRVATIYRYTGKPRFTQINIVSRYTFGRTGTEAFPMCHQASFHLKFARKYPLLALKLPKNRVVFKTGSVKNKGKKDAVV